MHQTPFPRRGRTALAALLLVTTLACGANLAPVLNVQNAPIAVAPPPGVDPGAHARQSILRAIAGRGWTIDSEQPGLITTTVRRNELFATVDVAYTPTAFSITYRNSAPEMKYDGERVHKRYNHWVDRLRASIQSEFNRAAAPGAPAPPPAVASPD